MDRLMDAEAARAGLGSGMFMIDDLVIDST